MKTLKYILVLALLVVLGFVAARYWKTPEELANTTIFGTDKDDVSDIDAPSQDFCYIWNTEAGDSASLRLTTSDGVSVTGSFSYNPAEKDSKSGPIKGSVGEVDEEALMQVAHLVWTATGEGVTNNEELNVELGVGTAKPGFGEMKLDAAKAMYVYANPAKVSYDITLQRTDCSDPVMK